MSARESRIISWCRKRINSCSLLSLPSSVSLHTVSLSLYLYLTPVGDPDPGSPGRTKRGGRVSQAAAGQHSPALTHRDPRSRAKVRHTHAHTCTRSLARSLPLPLSLLCRRAVSLPFAISGGERERWLHPSREQEGCSSSSSCPLARNLSNSARQQ